MTSFESQSFKIDPSQQKYEEGSIESLSSRTLQPKETATVFNTPSLTLSTNQLEENRKNISQYLESDNPFLNHSFSWKIAFSYSFNTIHSKYGLLSYNPIFFVYILLKIFFENKDLYSQYSKEKALKKIEEAQKIIENQSISTVHKNIINIEFEHLKMELKKNSDASVSKTSLTQGLETLYLRLSHLFNDESLSFELDLIYQNLDASFKETFEVKKYTENEQNLKEDYEDLLKNYRIKLNQLIQRSDIYSIYEISNILENHLMSIKRTLVFSRSCNLKMLKNDLANCKHALKKLSSKKIFMQRETTIQKITDIFKQLKNSVQLDPKFFVTNEEKIKKFEEITSNSLKTLSFRKLRQQIIEKLHTLTTVNKKQLQKLKRIIDYTLEQEINFFTRNIAAFIQSTSQTNLISNSIINDKANYKDLINNIFQTIDIEDSSIQVYIENCTQNFVHLIDLIDEQNSISKQYKHQEILKLKSFIIKEFNLNGFKVDEKDIESIIILLNLKNFVDGKKAILNFILLIPYGFTPQDFLNLIQYYQSGDNYNFIKTIEDKIKQNSINILSKKADDLVLESLRLSKSLDLFLTIDITTASLLRLKKINQTLAEFQDTVNQAVNTKFQNVFNNLEKHKKQNQWDTEIYDLLMKDFLTSWNQALTQRTLDNDSFKMINLNLTVLIQEIFPVNIGQNFPSNSNIKIYPQLATESIIENTKNILNSNDENFDYFCNEFINNLQNKLQNPTDSIEFQICFDSLLEFKRKYILFGNNRARLKVTLIGPELINHFIREFYKKIDEYAKENKNFIPFDDFKKMIEEIPLTPNGNIIMLDYLKNQLIDEFKDWNKILLLHLTGNLFKNYITEKFYIDKVDEFLIDEEYYNQIFFNEIVEILNI